MKRDWIDAWAGRARAFIDAEIAAWSGRRHDPALKVVKANTELLADAPRAFTDAEFEVVGEARPEPTHEPIRWVGLLELAWYGFGFLLLIVLGELLRGGFRAVFHGFR